MQLQRQSFIQTQKFVMNPLLIQSIRMMELPLIDLREKIEEELEKNPALEVLEDRTTVSLEATIKMPKEEDAYFETSSDSGFISRDGEAAAEEQRRFIEGILSHPETLQDHLLWQVRVEPIDDDIRTICEILIQNLDYNGFHKEAPELLFENENPVLIEKAKKIVQGLDPAGTCTADYKESLLVQIALLPDAPDGIVEALSHLELLERGKITEAAKLMNRTEKQVTAILEKLKELSPFPGRSFSVNETRYVIPDIQVARKEGEFVIILNNEEIPVLGINPFFMKIAGNKKMAETPENLPSESTPAAANMPAIMPAVNMPKNKLADNNQVEAKPVRDFARENIKEARWFINSINQRNHTMLRVTRAIVEFQRSFFMNGPKYLAPLTLRDIAEELGLHETTVSRIANNKYMQTEWGIFELRYFFSNSISGTGSGGSKYSKKGVKEIIREIIMSEQKRKTNSKSPLSDQDIVGLLAKRGITLARRTVAKYRNELDLGSSFDR